MSHAVGRPERQKGSVEDGFACMLDFLAEHVPDELAAWAQEVRLRMANFEPYRNREVVWVKPRTDANGEQYYVTRDGKTMPAEAFHRKYEHIKREKDQ